MYQIISNSMSLQREMRNIDVYYNVEDSGLLCFWNTVFLFAVAECAIFVTCCRDKKGNLFFPTKRKCHQNAVSHPDIRVLVGKKTVTKKKVERSTRSETHRMSREEEVRTEDEAVNSCQGYHTKTRIFR